VSDALGFVVQHGYLVLFAFVFAEQVGLPLPALPVLLAAGALAREGELAIGLVLAVAVAGSMTSDVIWYEIGRRRGMRVMNLLCRVSLEPDSCVRNTENFFARHGARSLVVAKFVPGLSTAAPPMAGIFGMRVPPFLLYDLLGTVLWVGVAVGLGWIFSNQLDAVVEAAADTGAGLGWIAGLALAAWLLFKWVQRRRFLAELRVARITPEELAGRLAAGEDIVVVDLRHSDEFALDPRTVPGALHLPVERLDEHRGRIPPDREVVLLCT